MKYRNDVNLSVVEVKDLEALLAPLTLDDAATLDNAALARSLAREAASVILLGPKVKSLAASPIWRLMCAELQATRKDAGEFQIAFLLASARLMVAGAEAERSSR